MDFFSAEDRDGVRFSWNLWPGSSSDAKQLVAPISCLYSPLKQSFDTPMVNYDPIACSCHSLLNPFCEVDFGAKVWSCPFCLNRNKFPAYYECVSPTNLPAELHPHATTIEYALSSGASGPAPGFIFGSSGINAEYGGRNKSGNIAETQIGIGGTSEWRAAVMDPYSAIGIYFEVNNPRDLPISGKFGVIQFKTTYTHPSGQRMLRCTTLARNWVPKGSTPEVLLSGFDQEATVALISRVAIYKAQTEDIDLLKWLDSHLIRFCRKFAQYQPNNENNFSLPDGMALYPTFMFHLRRSPFVNIFGYSPDETVWYRYYLLKECTGNILIMVQPALDQYTFDREQPLPVLLSPNSLRDDVLLLLDTFFQVVVWSGRTISQWKKANYHLLPEYENLKQLLEAPVTDATSILKERYPHPLYVETEHRESQERYLLAMVDPEAGSQGLNSEDASYSRFLEHLKRYTVKTE
eukprot:TRINITY_DN1939_c0_g1_i9.p1 TRINITY_DN1939_c0_g1~~TRINITY_DN1939_c0_g1_i9.p1  ORF type:complete len:488 (+),score=86.34 TRINITY_DN1939_c0_g1_i9:74-1465(+)